MFLSGGFKTRQQKAITAYSDLPGKTTGYPKMYPAE
jgi:hypothetical protein